MTRHLVVNADDFGLSAGVNAGIVEAHRRGIVTSASLMVWQPAAADGAALAREMPALSLGLHLDLGEWRATGREWEAVYQRAPLDDAGQVAAEVDAQLARFTQLVGRPPTHLDSHQHVHRDRVVGDVMAAHAEHLGVPLRECSGVAYVGGFYGQDEWGRSYPELLTPAALYGLLSSLAPGWSELGCHPGFAEDTDSVYREERRLEVEALCDPALRRWLDDEGIVLTAYGATT